MTKWENKIIDAFISHYFSGADETEENRKSLRIRSSIFFSNFETAAPDEKESYLEAAESLKHKGVIKLNWEKHDKGERLKTLTCENFEKLFETAGKPYPETEAEKIRNLFNVGLIQFKGNRTAENYIAFLEFFALHFSPREIGLGIDRYAVEELIRFLEFSCEEKQLENITIRALSILLYSDSKHLENLLALCKPMFTRLQKTFPFLNFTIPERSYPETMIAGKISFQYKNIDTPMVNAAGHILNLPLITVQEIDRIFTVSEKIEKTVLTIENKETFFALGSPQKIDASKNLSRFDCFLYTGGYSNSTAAILIKILADSGFTFYHAGDLDPDGILILQHIMDIAEKPVTPLHMNAATFDQYLAWGRTLSKPMLRQIEKIREETMAISGLADLVQRIKKTGLGIEQEIIDYR